MSASCLKKPEEPNISNCENNTQFDGIEHYSDSDKISNDIIYNIGGDVMMDFNISDTVYEAEDAELISVEIKNNEFAGSYSGEGYIGLFELENSKAVFTVTAMERTA
jgi:hypothetical protein